MLVAPVRQEAVGHSGMYSLVNPYRTPTRNHAESVRWTTFFFSSLLLSSLKLSDTKFYEPLDTSPPRNRFTFLPVVVLKLRTVPIGTALSLRILRVIRRWDHQPPEE